MNSRREATSLALTGFGGFGNGGKNVETKPINILGKNSSGPGFQAIIIVKIIIITFIEISSNEHYFKSFLSAN